MKFLTPALILLLLLLPTASNATWSDTTRKAEAQGGGVGFLDVTLNSTVAGNLVVCGTSSYIGGGTAMDPVITDGGNTWTKSITQQGSGAVQAASLSYSVLGTGGNRTINSDPGTGSYDMSIYVHEFSGSHSSPASGTPVGNNGSGAVVSTTAMTPADNDVLVIAVEGNTATGTVSENAGGEGFTLSNDHESGFNAEPGSMVFKILSGAPGTPSHSWVTVSGEWAAVIAAYKPAAAGATVPNRPRSLWFE